MYLRPGYHSEANSIIQPERFFTVGRYFLRYWLPTLGPAQAWVLTELRQQCREKEEGESLAMDKKQLAENAGLELGAVETMFSRPSDLSWFVKCTPGEGGAKSYTVNLYDPLTPQHQAGLAVILRRAAGELEPALQELLKLPAWELRNQLEQAADTNELNSRTVTGIVTDVFKTPLKYGSPAHHLCERLADHIILPGDLITITHYFRQRWVSQLGPALAWLVVVLRSRATGESGDCTWRKQDLAAALGLPTSRLRRLLTHEHAPGFFEITDSTAGNLTFKVNFDEPVVPADQGKFLLQRSLTGEEYYVATDV